MQLQNPLHLGVDTRESVLHVLVNGLSQIQYPVSLAANGLGEEKGSEKTPRGWHYIRAKIGVSLPENAVLVGRRPTGEIYTPELGQMHPGRDWILTRIFWLCGLEKGRNRGGNVDTMQRYIYLHGTPDHVQMQRPGSRGCIRMRNRDIIELFHFIPVGTKLLIGDLSLSEQEESRSTCPNLHNPSTK